MGIQQLFDLSGKTALITGSSRGIGKALAFALAEYGAEVIVHGAHNLERVQTVASTIHDTFGHPAHALAVDLSEDDAPQRLYNSATQVVGNIDILILNASVQVRKSWQDISREEYDLQMSVNFRASFESVQLFLPSMLERNWGRIVTVGSVQQIKPHPEMLIYAASKDAQMSLVRNLSKQVATYGVTVNNLAPGVINTDRNTAALADPLYREKVLAQIPVHFVAEPADCAGTALLLCSDAGRYITGTNIIVDGGMQL